MAERGLFLIRLLLEGGCWVRVWFCRLGRFSLLDELLVVVSDMVISSSSSSSSGCGCCLRGLEGAVEEEEDEEEEEGDVGRGISLVSADGSFWSPMSKY